MIVEVKKEHIENGVQGCPCYCAVSLAVYKALEDKYKFTDSQSLDISKAEVEVGESWVETAVQGYGAEISIYTKLKPKKFGQDVKIVEDYLEIKDGKWNTYDVESWIEDFDTFDDSKPISFAIESINRMNN